LSAQPLPASATAGWYPDPAGRHQYRHWTGTAWSSQVDDDGVVGDDPEGTDGMPPLANLHGWYPDPAGRWLMRWWNGAEWTHEVDRGDGKGDPRGQDVDLDKDWPPPSAAAMAPPPRPHGPKMGMKTGWHLGAKWALKATKRNRCLQCGGHLSAVPVAYPGCKIDYTIETTDIGYQPCGACGWVPPWSQRAGLYPDPSGTHEYRYWDGGEWTEAVADDGVGATAVLA
jgi:hypothetical protein